MTPNPLTNDRLPAVSADLISAAPANRTPGEKRRPLLAAWTQFKRLTQVGLPRRFPIVQFPNAPLLLAFLAGMIGGALSGSARSYATAAAYLAMTVWAYEELVRGVNWFRRLLGLAYMIIMIVRVAHGLRA
ncbi:MAG TPA: hypothetical protein VG294_03960 [Solirubrobacteraceae bacterium]|jgi:hypothetical protein|nr:hypothetical protein [Solirubrobacteraceae bacterium]